MALTAYQWRFLLIHGMPRLINGIHRLIDSISRLINGIAQLPHYAVTWGDLAGRTRAPK